MVVQLKIDGGKLTFNPPFRELRDILLRLLTDIVQNAAELPRVSYLPGSEINFLMRAPSGD